MLRSVKALKIVIISILVIALVSIILVVTYLRLISCKDEMKKKYYSPNKNYLAEVYYRDCGGSSSDWIIDIFNENKGFFSKDRWNRVFISNQDNIGIEWVDQYDLKIKYPANSQIFKQLNFWQDVKIEYAPIAENSGDKK